MTELLLNTGIANFELGQLGMLVVCGVLLYLAIAKEFEPLLLLPIGFGGILANVPVAGIAGPEGFLGIIYDAGVSNGLFPLLIFMGVGALTDFSPLIAHPKTALLGAAAQFGQVVPAVHVQRFPQPGDAVVRAGIREGRGAVQVPQRGVVDQGHAPALVGVHADGQVAADRLAHGGKYFEWQTHPAFEIAAVAIVADVAG